MLNCDNYLIEVFDINGKLIQKDNWNVSSNCTFELKTTQIKSGIYLLKISSEKTLIKKVSKISIQH